MTRPPGARQEKRSCLRLSRDALVPKGGQGCFGAPTSAVNFRPPPRSGGFRRGLGGSWGSRPLFPRGALLRGHDNHVHDSLSPDHAGARRAPLLDRHDAIPKLVNRVQAPRQRAGGVKPKHDVLAEGLAQGAACRGGPHPSAALRHSRRRMAFPRRRAHLRAEKRAPQGPR